jgi:hypothetical protein
VKVRAFVLTVLTAVFCCSTSRAAITSASWWDDGDGALHCTWTNLTLSGDGQSGTLSMAGDQYWGPGHMVGTIDTTGGSDPRLTLGSSIINDTNFAWTAYTVNVYLSSLFTIANSGSLSAYVDNPPNSDWSVSVVEPSPSYTVPSGQFAGDYEGTLNLSSGTPVAIGGELDFGYTIQFSGASEFSIGQEVIPVPEPGTFVLVAMSGLLLGWRTLARRRA